MGNNKQISCAYVNQDMQCVCAKEGYDMTQCPHYKPSIPAHIVDDMKLDSYYDGFKDGSKLTGEGKQDDCSSFILPSKWCIKRTPENYEMVNEWANDVLRIKYLEEPYYFLHSEFIQSKWYNKMHPVDDKAHFPIITTIDFVEYVYKPWNENRKASDTQVPGYTSGSGEEEGDIYDAVLQYRDSHPEPDKQGEEKEGKVVAPFTTEQVNALNKWQKLGYVHEFTCKCSTPLIADKSGWFCKSCITYVQNWAHNYMADEAKHPVDPLKEFRQPTPTAQQGEKGSDYERYYEYTETGAGKKWDEMSEVERLKYLLNKRKQVIEMYQKLVAKLRAQQPHSTKTPKP